jgi:hypothetical protein
MLIDLPESPRYLIAHDRIDEARVVLADLTGDDYKTTDAIVLAQVRATMIVQIDTVLNSHLE